MRLDFLPQSIFRMVLALGVVLGVSTPLLTLAQDAIPAEETQEAPAPPAPGNLQIAIYGSDGIPLSGSFAVSDSTGAYQQVWASGGSALASNVAAGTASVSQLSGTTDYALDYTVIYVDVPAGGTASATFSNVFLDGDGDTIGDSVDVCAAGNDRVDSDADGVADACDNTPTGDPTPAPTSVPAVEPTVAPTVVPTLVPTQGPALDSTPEPIATDAATAEDATALSVEVAAEPVIVEVAPVSCQAAEAVSPWIVSDLEDYPPGGLVTLSSGSWVPGQVVEILVEDDGIADAEMGEWTHTATVTADQAGGFTYSFNIAPWYVADYSVVATGECSTATTTFTDSVTPVSGNLNACSLEGSDLITTTNPYVTFRCVSSGSGQNGNPIKINASLSNMQWQWQHIFSAVPTAPDPAKWTQANLADTEASGNVRQVYIYLRPLSTTAPGSIGSVTVNVKSPSGAVEATATLTAYLLPSSTDFTLSCLPTTLAVELNKTDTVTCTIKSSTLATGATVTLNGSPSITNVPTNWTQGTVRISPGSTVTKSAGVDTLFTFTIPLTPTSCSAATGGIRVSASLAFQGQTITLTPADPASTISLKPSGALSVSVDSLKTAMTWDQPYSLTGYPLNAGSLTYSITSPGCGGWNVQVSASNFVRTGGGDPIPASNLTLTQAQAPAPATTGLNTSVTSGSLSSPLKVLSAQASVPTGTYTQTLNINMSIPAGTLAGTYTSTVTVTAAAGP